MKIIRSLAPAAKKSKGYSLVELLVVITLIALLCTLSLPHYQAFVRSSKRQQAQLKLYHLAARVEQEKNLARGYTLSHINEQHNAYVFTLHTHLSHYTLYATPRDSQTQDPCGTLSLNELGQQGAAKPNCWKE